MMRLIIAVTFFYCLASLCSDAVPIPGRYMFPKKPEYIPVYIRHGNTPLNEINAYLADAFHENMEAEQPHKLKYIKDKNDSSSSEESNESNERYNVKIHYRKDKDDTSESDESSEETRVGYGGIHKPFFGTSDFAGISTNSEIKEPTKLKRTARSAEDDDSDTKEDESEINHDKKKRSAGKDVVIVIVKNHHNALDSSPKVKETL